MIDWLQTLPNITLGILIMSTAFSVSTVIPILVRYHFKLDYNDESLAKGAEEGFKLVTTVTLLLLAFCLVRAQENHRNVEDLVARESTIIYKLHREFAIFGGNEAAILQAKTRRYATSEINDEWALLAKGMRSSKTSALLADLSDGSRQLIPETRSQQFAQSEILATLMQIADVREARLSASHLSLPVYYWQAITCAILLLIIVGWFQHPLPKLAIYVGGVVLGVSLILTLLIAVDGIFTGQNRVTPIAIERILPLLAPSGAASPLSVP
jgi:hypothetical protein